MKLLILGVNGMIGSTLFKAFRKNKNFTVWGTLHSNSDRHFFSENEVRQIIDGVDAIQTDKLMKTFVLTKPDIIINCIGITKHRRELEDPIETLDLNSLLPHRLARICDVIGARLIHISTDCVFQGIKGGYVEADFPDAHDFYGRSKSIGEVAYAANTITIRTSTIGHELGTRYGLLEWFLSQKGSCRGFSKAIFSGLPTIIFAQILSEYIFPRPDLNGLYHISTKPINKLDLLRLISKIYKKDINIIPDDSFSIDRSLNGNRFSNSTGFIALDWEEMISIMYTHSLKGFD
jgi:dTDP-4-dehydrorhamnose reductase